MYKIFNTLTEYNQYTNNGTNLTSGVTYYVKEDGSTHFQTNNIDGEEKVYDMMDEIPEGYIIPTGNISITENGENINVNDYATATVNVAGSGGNEDLIDLIERDITSITIPSGTTTIGVNIFYDCRGLTSVTIPNSVTSIGSSAFNGCTGLTSVTIPSSVTSFGERAFSGCTGLTNVTIDNGVTSIGGSMFTGCTGLTSINIPDSVTSIGSSAFNGCTGLTSVTIPNSVTSFGDRAFQNCSVLTSINIPNSVTSINGYTFQGCRSLTEVTIPNSVTSIGSSAFSGCTGLTSITVEATTPPTLSNINAFSNTNNCPIYVPAESLDLYKNASNWKNYADRIEAIA